jgi:hypothetical protein
MKNSNRLLILALSGGSILTVSALALSRPTNPDTANAAIKARIYNPDSGANGESPEDTESSSLRRDLDRVASEIRSKTGMSSCLEISEDGDHSVEEAYAAGWIVDVTLQEVEAALKAAAATPGFDDDIAAKRLAHRGSYRYFYQK